MIDPSQNAGTNPFQRDFAFMIVADQMCTQDNASSARCKRSRRASPFLILASSSHSLKSNAAFNRRCVKVWRCALGKWFVAGKSHVRKSKVRVNIGISCWLTGRIFHIHCFQDHYRYYFCYISCVKSGLNWSPNPF